MRSVFRRHSDRGEDPASAFFDDAYYGATYPDVVQSGVGCFEHYMADGWREGRNPSPTFVTLYYRDKHLGGASKNPLSHYARDGAERGLSPGPVDAAEYLEVQRSVCAPFFAETDYRARSGYAGADALGHYLRQGWREGAPPSFHFDGADHLRAHHYIEALGVSPFYHYASRRRMSGRSPTATASVLVTPPPDTVVASFEAPDYRLAYPDLIELAPIPPALRATLDPIWRMPEVAGKPVVIRRLHDVYLASEGLIFTRDVKLIDLSRSHHSDHDVRSHAEAVAAVVRRPRRARVIEKGILAENRGAGNYGHFILEMLPRAWFARTTLGLDWPAIIHGGTSAIQQVCRQALACAGFAPEAVVAVGQEPVFVRELVVVDGLAHHPLYISPLALRCFDDMTAHVPAGAVRRLYAPRAPAIARDFEEEGRVAAVLAASGFERVVTTGMSFEDQVALFRGAEEVVGVAGAALTNLLFCRPGTRVAVFSPTSAAEVLFWTIAQMRDLAYTEVRCPEVGPNLGVHAWDHALRVGADDIRRVLDAMRRAPAPSGADRP